MNLARAVFALMVLSVAPAATYAQPGADPRSSAEVFDPTFYLSKYPDLRKSFGNDLGAATRHWLANGIRECRQGHASFSLKAYLDRYPDLQRATGGNCSAALDHWLRAGKNEKRDPAPTDAPTAPPPSDPRAESEIFDPRFYLNANPDLRTAFGADVGAATRHWLSHGIGECREGHRTFSLKGYLHRYPDLREAHGGDCAAALNHWLRFGKNEKRNPALRDLVQEEKERLTQKLQERREREELLERIRRENLEKFRRAEARNRGKDERRRKQQEEYDRCKASNWPRDWGRCRRPE